MQKFREADPAARAFVSPFSLSPAPRARFQADLGPRSRAPVQHVTLCIIQISKSDPAHVCADKGPAHVRPGA